MEVEAIIGELSSSNGLPRAALSAATERRAELAPIFIAEIERYVAAGSDGRTQPDALFFMFHLLGEWREAAAYPALARFLRMPTAELDRILDDAVTLTVHRVMIAVFDGDPQPLYDIILDPDANEYVRSRMCETLAILVGQGKLARGEAAEFFRAAFAKIQPQEADFVWFGWQNAIAAIGLEDLAPLVEEAFRRGYVEREAGDFLWFQDALRATLALPGKYHWADAEDDRPFGNTIEEFSKWYGFTDAYRRDLERSREAAREWLSRQATVYNFNRNVGRNDSCPCGSGKKFKKCCLN
jgi:hypothetical protein